MGALAWSAVYAVADHDRREVLLWTVDSSGDRGEADAVAEQLYALRDGETSPVARWGWERWDSVLLRHFLSADAGLAWLAELAGGLAGGAPGGAAAAHVTITPASELGRAVPHLVGYSLLCWFPDGAGGWSSRVRASGSSTSG